MIYHIKQKLYQFMRNRNGMDELNKMLLLLAVILNIVSMFTGFGLLYSLGIVADVIFVFRVLSRNIADRQRENKKYNSLVNLNKLRFEQRKEYKIFSCRSCGKNIRVPRKRGKIEVTCPICGNKKIFRT